jgi:hypothetical protein
MSHTTLYGVDIVWAPPELQNNCALCGKPRGKPSDFIKETIGGRNFRFDTNDCAVMFETPVCIWRRFQAVFRK